MSRILAATASRTADGGFAFPAPVEINREAQGASKLDAFARWAAKRYRKETEGEMTGPVDGQTLGKEETHET